MNIVKELRKKKGIQQKELAISIGVSRPTVSEWESNKKDPSGERLKKLAEFFGVDELVILGRGIVDLDRPETEQIKEMILDRLREGQPKTDEARILAAGIDKLPKPQREQALNVVKAMFHEHSAYFEKGDDDEAGL